MDSAFFYWKAPQRRRGATISTTPVGWHQRSCAHQAQPDHSRENIEMDQDVASFIKTGLEQEAGCIVDHAVYRQAFCWTTSETRRMQSLYVDRMLPEVDRRGSHSPPNPLARLGYTGTRYKHSAQPLLDKVAERVDGLQAGGDDHSSSSHWRCCSTRSEALLRRRTDGERIVRKLTCGRPCDER